MKPTRRALILSSVDEAQQSITFRGETLVATLNRTLGEYFDEVATICHDGSAKGELLALAEGLNGIGAVDEPHLFVVCASMPFTQYPLMRKFYALREGHDAVVACVDGDLLPLCGVYSKNCAAKAIELAAGDGSDKPVSLLALLDNIDSLVLDAEELLALDPLGLSFLKVEDDDGLEKCKKLLALADGALPPALSFVAKSGTGKTTLLEKVISEMTSRGWRVGSVKHDAHRFEIDHEGKDSWRLTRAGASPMIVSAPEKLAMVRPNPAGEMPLEVLIRRYLVEADIVITEGYKTGPLQKIEINRSERSDTLLCVGDDGELTDKRLIAVVSDAELSLPVPLLKLSDVAEICNFIEKTFLL